MQKAEIRKLNKQLRSEMSNAEVLLKSTDICLLFLKSEIYKNAKTIMLYMPLGNEVDTTEIMKAAFADGKRVILPVTDADNRIIPYSIDSATCFRVGRFLVSEPIDAQLADPKCIDVVIVPGIAFDKAGNRVGFGKGCYDNFLKEISAVRVGICYGFQICDEILADPHDETMNYVVYEKGWL